MNLAFWGVEPFVGQIQVVSFFLVALISINLRNQEKQQEDLRALRIFEYNPCFAYNFYS